MVVGRRLLLGDADPGGNEHRLLAQSVSRRRSRSEFLLNRPQLVHTMVGTRVKKDFVKKDV